MAPQKAAADVAVLVGSLRKESFNRKIAQALIAMAPESLAFRFVEIGHLGLYNQDMDAAFPDHWTAFKSGIEKADALLFATPEYNRSMPGVLKNAIDIGSRPFGKSCWGAKPGAVISASPGAVGGFGANHHLRQVLTAVGIYVMPQPEVYIPAVDKKLDAEGNVTDEGTKKFLGQFIASFEKWVARFAD